MTVINAQYKLVKPLTIETIYTNVDYNKQGQVLVKPTHLSICKADLRYYLGERSAKVLRSRLPISLIHEAVGVVLSDPSGRYERNAKVVLLPNIPGKSESYLENYRLDSIFCSSKVDGFMQEMVSLSLENVIPYGRISDDIATITEFVSIGVHALESFLLKANCIRNSIAVWGDGGLGYVVASMLKVYLPNAYLTVIGMNSNRLDMFSFADKTLLVDDVTKTSQYDHAFECVGGKGSEAAINQIIDTIQPEGTITLLGVSEETVAVNTRMVLEKGLSIVGRSRSTKEDFEKCIDLLTNDEQLESRISMLISRATDIHCNADIHNAFEMAKNVDFKVLMNWKI